jgi:uncharacterized membrane protein
MRALLSAVAAACLVALPFVSSANAQILVPPGDPPKAPGGGPTGPGNPNVPGGPTNPGGPAASPTFLLKVCNKAQPQYGPAYISIISVIENGKQYRAQGWWTIPNAQCVDVGNFNRPGVFLHGMAKGGDVTWANQKNVYCVNRNSGFDYTFGEPRQCGAGEDLAGFFQMDVDNRTPVMTQTLN